MICSPHRVAACGASGIVFGLFTFILVIGDAATLYHVRPLWPPCNACDLCAGTSNLYLEMCRHVVLGND
jgi:hypothetical protein